MGAIELLMFLLLHPTEVLITGCLEVEGHMGLKGEKDYVKLICFSHCNMIMF